MPTQDDARAGEPLSDGSGKWFDALCHRAKVDRPALHIINTINCVKQFYPDRKSHDGAAAIDHCYRNHVKPVLDRHPWTRIDLLGEEALNLLTGKHSIAKWRGSPLPLADSTDNKTVCLPTIHPSEIAKNQELMPVVVNDLRKSLLVPAENYNLYPSLADVQQFTATEFAFDLETSYGVNPATGKYDIKIVGLSAKPTTAIVVPFAGAYISELKRIFTNAKVLIAHNGLQFDIPILFDQLDIEWRPE